RSRPPVSAAHSHAAGSGRIVPRKLQRNSPPGQRVRRDAKEARTDERSHVGGSEEAEQQERSPDGGATSGSEGHVGRIARESDK
ncbi:MAG TPA: hypothetical protein VGZ06_03510, partial [Candidatus Cybelea sp.]|nr:hypothetical protein [Candidatus Cybelea sp.]